MIDRTELNLFAYLNVSLIGQTTSGIRGLDFHDNDARALIHLPLAEEMIEKHRDVIKGIKVRVYTGMKDLYALEQARILADRTGLPILVHIGPAPPAAADTLKLLRAGDMITHPYHGGSDTILDENGRIRGEFTDARARGVEVDLGMDRFHCDLTVMRRAFDLGFHPDYVSSDLTLTNINSITFDLPTTVANAWPAACRWRRRSPVAPRLSRPSSGCRGSPASWPPAMRPISRSSAGRRRPSRWVDFFGNGIPDAHRLTNVATILRGRVLGHRPTDVGLWDTTERSVPWANYR